MQHSRLTCIRPSPQIGPRRLGRLLLPRRPDLRSLPRGQALPAVRRQARPPAWLGGDGWPPRAELDLIRAWPAVWPHADCEAHTIADAGLTGSAGGNMEEQIRLTVIAADESEAFIRRIVIYDAEKFSHSPAAPASVSRLAKSVCAARSASSAALSVAAWVSAPFVG